MSLTSNMTIPPVDRLGYSKAYLAEHSPNYKDREKAECYIPTRHEVFNLPAEELLEILLNWKNNAPEEIKMGDKQKKALVFLLRSRRDRDSFAELVTMLRKELAAAEAAA